MKRLLHITDTHLFADESATQRGVVTAASLAAVLKASKAETADMVLISGDLCQDESRAGYRLLRKVLARMSAPVVCLPGNHDDLRYMRDELAGEHIQVLGSHAIGNWRLLALDCTVPGAVHGTLGGQRLASADAALTANPDLPTLVSLHHPPIACGSDWLDGSRLTDGDALMRMLANHRQVRGVLCGHIHQQLDEMVGHVRVLATPSTCKQFAENHDAYATDEQAPGWRWLSLRDDDFDTHIGRLTDSQYQEVMR